MDPAVIPERIFDAAYEGRLGEVEAFLASVAAPRDVVIRELCASITWKYNTSLSCDLWKALRRGERRTRETAHFPRCGRKSHRGRRGIAALQHNAFF